MGKINTCLMRADLFIISFAFYGTWILYNSGVLLDFHLYYFFYNTATKIFKVRKKPSLEYSSLFKEAKHNFSSIPRIGSGPQTKFYSCLTLR